MYLLKKIIRCVLPFAFFAGSVRAQETWKIAESQISDIQPGFYLQRLSLNKGDVRVVLHFAVFNSDRFKLTVHDFGSEGASDIAQAARDANALAGINAGYFHPDYTPLGLVISGGKVIHSQERASLLSGIFAANAESLYLLRPAEFKQGTRTLEALQAGPYLVDQGVSVKGLNAVKRARRSFVLTDGSKQWAIGTCFSPTLANLGELLTLPDLIPDFKIYRALNLDGGSSTGFWVKRSGKPLYFRELARIRNCLLIIPR